MNTNAARTAAHAVDTLAETLDAFRRSWGHTREESARHIRMIVALYPSLAAMVPSDVAAELSALAAMSQLDAARVQRGQLNRFLVRAADGLYIEGDFACFLDARHLANELGAAGAAAVIVDAWLIESDESDDGVVWRY